MGIIFQVTVKILAPIIFSHSRNQYGSAAPVYDRDPPSQPQRSSGALPSAGHHRSHPSVTDSRTKLCMFARQYRF